MIKDGGIKQQLQKLGFSEFEEMLQSAIELEKYPLENPRIENGYVLYHFFDELNLDASCWITVGELPSGQIVIHSIQTSIQIESDKTLEGVGFLGKKYFLKDGPLPDIDKIKKGIQETVRIHEIKERLAKRQLAKENKMRSLGL